MPTTPPDPENFGRLERPLSLTLQVEQLLRRSIAEGKFADGKLPTEMELAEQLGVSRETVRLAAENLQREGLLVKIRRKGTFTQMRRLPEELPLRASKLIGYLHAQYQAAEGQVEEVSRVVSGLMMQGALEEASSAGNRLLAHHAAHTQIGKGFRELHQEHRLGGVIFASYGEEKLLKRVASLGLPTVLLDHDLHLPGIHSVRDDSSQGARDAITYLAALNHRRIAYVNWRQVELNPWRLQGYRQGLKDAGLRRQVSLEWSVEVTRAGAKQAVDLYLNHSPRPTALYCFNNTLAKILIEELATVGVKTPDDVSIMGGGGEMVPSLTCHQTDWHEIGRLAVRVLHQAMRSPEGLSQHLLVPHTIREGGSVKQAEK